MVTMAHKTKGFVCHHIPKTGGTSIGNWIAKNMGQEVYFVGQRGVRTLTRDTEGEMFVGWSESNPDHNNWMKWWFKHAGLRNGFGAHNQVSLTKKILYGNPRTKHLKKNFWHFAFLRNPYDWLTSLFWHRKHIPSPMNKIYNKVIDNPDQDLAFAEFIFCLENRDGLKSDRLQSFWLNSKVDFIGDFDNLERDFRKIMSRFDIEVNNFPKTNTQPKNKSVYLWNNPEILARATNLLSKDIELYEKTFNKKASYERG